MTDVEGSLNQLTRRTTAIRKAGTRYRLHKADATFDPSVVQVSALGKQLELLLLVHPNKHGTSASFEGQLVLTRLTLV